jgi:decaprenylphospho-beta-D-ribofuranose 2-oxidase
MGPTFASLLTEFSVILMFLLALLNAFGQGRRWVSTVAWGAIAGYFAEYFIVHADNPRYSYGTHLFLIAPLDVPVCIGLGWGIVFYASTWAAQRLRIRSIGVSSLIAGMLGVSVDLSLDPVAHHHKFWVWEKPPAPFSDVSTLCGVPFDNFVAWVALIGIYGYVVRKAFRFINEKRYGADEKAQEVAAAPHAAGSQRMPGGVQLTPVPITGRGLFLDLVVPPAAAALAGLAFVLVRERADLLYALVGRFNLPVGEAIVFAVIFVAGAVAFWNHVLRGSRNEEVNVVVLLIPLYLHTLSLYLLVEKIITEDISDYTLLLVFLPINLVASMLAYAWPSLDPLLDRFRRESDQQMPIMQYATLSSYAGTKVRALVCKPRSEAELTATLEYARRLDKRVTFRAGGQSFDTQALNDQIVISLERLDTVRDVRETPDGNATITVGAGATWGRILKKTLPHGFAPFVMVTSSSATAGGTLSSNSLARFSASCGREGHYIEHFRLLTVDGRILECSRTQHPGLFKAAIGGLGYVGAVLEITYRLLKLPAPNAQIETQFTRVEGLERIAQGIGQTGAGRFSPIVNALAQKIPSTPVDDNRPIDRSPIALSAVVLMRGGTWGLVARSEYVKPTRLRRSIFHSPNSLLHLLLQFAATIPWLRTLGYWLTFRVSYRQPRSHVDTAFGYTFFEDGNRRLRRLLHILGIPGRILQQTFIIPGGPNRDTAALDAFLKCADQYLDGKGLEPALIDVLYVLRDQDDFVLSSSHGLDGFAVTFTFERLFRDIAKERSALMHLSALCNAQGGRVHLVKNVCADEETIGKMYENAIITLRGVREAYGAVDVLLNEFSHRVLRGIELEERRA